MVETGVLGKGAYPDANLHLRHVIEANATTCSSSAADDATGSMMSAEDEDALITGEKEPQR